MVTVTFQKLYVRYAPRIDSGSLRLVQYPEAYGNLIADFCSTVKGERKLILDWGLPDFIHQTDITTDEMKAILLVNLTKYFPECTFEIEVKNINLGVKQADITYKLIDDSSGMITIQF